MATKKTKLKLSPNTKIFVIIAIIIGAAVILGGVPQTAQFIASRCSGTHVACADIKSPYAIPGFFDATSTNISTVLMAQWGIQCYVFHGCTSGKVNIDAQKYIHCVAARANEPHSCSSLTSQTNCKAEAQYGCKWTPSSISCYGHTCDATTQGCCESTQRCYTLSNPTSCKL